MANSLSVSLPSPQELDYLRVRYRSDVRLLTARWQRPVNSAELREGYAAMLCAAEAAGCFYWLVDVRSRTTASPADAQWLATEFFPQLPTRLVGPVCLGYLLPPRFDFPLQSPEAAGPVAGLSVQYFDEEGALTRWLASCQPVGSAG